MRNSVFTSCSLLCLLVLLPVAASADFAGGSGSAESPWQIATAEQLDRVRDDLNSHYILINDIDLGHATGTSSGAFWHGGAGWRPIGDSLGNSFIGSLDGNGYSITGLYINRSGKEQAGLFGWIGYGSRLTALGLEAVDISGGIAVGGLLASNFGGVVETSFVTGQVNGEQLVGGVVGRNLSGTITDSYFAGSVHGQRRIGGLAGSNWAAIRNSYVTANVDGSNDVGGLVGAGSRAVSNSYWDVSVSGLQTSAGGGTALSSTQLREPSSFRGFDFGETWRLTSSGAPVLIANTQNPPPVPPPPVEDPPSPEPPVNDDPIPPVVPGDGHDFSGAVHLTGSGAFEGVSVRGHLDTIDMPAVFDAGADGQIAGNGELVIASEGARIVIRPFRASTAAADQVPGVFIDRDGNVVLVARDRRQITGYPVSADTASLSHALEDLDLSLLYGDRAVMRLSARNVPNDGEYFAARADTVAVPVEGPQVFGLFFRAVPELPGASLAYLAFPDEHGNPLQQQLAPAPADWPALEHALAATAGISNIRIDPQGIISVTLDGQDFRGRLGYEVRRSNSATDTGDDQAVIVPVGDENGDGTEDFRVHYPSGDSQLLSILPAAR